MIKGVSQKDVVGYSGLPAPPVDVEIDHMVPYFYQGTYHGQPTRLVVLRQWISNEHGSDWLTVIVGQYRRFSEQLVWASLLESSLRLGSLILLAAALGWLAVSKGLKPLRQLEAIIESRSPDDLSPLNVVMPREVTQLLKALNGFLHRLNLGAERKRRFIANASHQLKTPVASLMAQTELDLRKVDQGRSCGELTHIHHRTIQMSRLIQQLLSLARADSADPVHSHYDSLNLVTFAKSATLNWLNQTHLVHIDLGFESVLNQLFIKGNRTLLTELLNNLLDNANRYCPPHTLVTVCVYQTDDSAVLAVEDAGLGIAVEERDKVLERFYRGCEDFQGSGLGLSIADEVAKKHGGTLQLSAGNEGNGLIVRIALPHAHNHLIRL